MILYIISQNECFHENYMEIFVLRFRDRSMTSVGDYSLTSVGRQRRFLLIALQNCVKKYCRIVSL